MVDGQTGKIIFRSRISSNKSTSLCTVIVTVHCEVADCRVLVVMVVVLVVIVIVVHGSVWCWNLDAPGNRSETPGKF